MSAETIVVGVDGSEGGKAALAFAAGEAAARGARLRVVAAWEVPVAAYGDGFTPPLDQSTWDVFQSGAQRAADDAVAAVKSMQPSIEVEAQVVQGHAADVLLSQGAEASLIVVGRRGLGGFASLLLGSVSHHVVQHATSPVVVVNA